MNEFATLLARATAPVRHHLLRRQESAVAMTIALREREVVDLQTAELLRSDGGTFGQSARHRSTPSSRRAADGGSPIRNRNRSSLPALRAVPAGASSALKPTTESFDGSGAFLVGTGGRLVRLNPWASSRGLQSDREHSATVIARARCVHSLFHDR